MAIQKNINIKNKKARFEFEILDKFVAGIQLTGTEIKSIRLSQARITESFCEFNEGGELFIVNISFDFVSFFRNRIQNYISFPSVKMYLC